MNFALHGKKGCIETIYYKFRYKGMNLNGIWHLIFMGVMFIEALSRSFDML